MRRLLALATSTAIGLACSSSSNEGEARQCLAAPAPVDLTQPTVSFRTTIAPLVGAQCSFPACHGDPNNSLGIYLPNDPSQIYKALRAPATSSLKLDVVKPGAPDESFVMRKLDGTQCALDADCVKGSCGNVMPPNDILSIEDRNAFRRWIAQGALDN